MTHLLVTNDFPPKIGGIQTYLWELWRRLPSEAFAVLTTPHPRARAFDACQEYRVARVSAPALVPSISLVRRIRQMAEDVGATLVVLDPALPLGMVGPRLGMPYAVVIHGAEVTVPSRIPGARAALSHVLGNAAWLLATGEYPADAARRVLGGSVPPVSVIPPGVDTSRFRPFDAAERAATRERWRLPSEARIVVSVSRLVPRKGMDVLIDASACLARKRPEIAVAISGEGRERGRLALRIVRTGAPARLLGA
ncbi:MAG: glycosyltransferase family 4 protein, partial [Mycobacterium sp.]